MVAAMATTEHEVRTRIICRRRYWIGYDLVVMINNNIVKNINNFNNNFILMEVDFSQNFIIF